MKQTEMIKKLEKDVEYWKVEAQRHKEVARELSLKLEELRGKGESHSGTPQT